MEEFRELARAQNDVNFIEKMNTAEKLAKARGGISPFDRPSAAARFAIIVTSGVGAYQLYNNPPEFEGLWEDTKSWVESFFTSGDKDETENAESSN